MFLPFGGMFGPDASTTPMSSDDEIRVTRFRLEVCFIEPAPALVIEPDPTGGGTVPPGTDPTKGMSVCGGEVILVWDEIIPAGSSTVYRFSKVPINIGDPKDPRVESFGSFTRALSNDTQEFRGTSVSAVYIDKDRVLATLEESDSLIGARFSRYLTTEAAARARAIAPSVLNLPLRVFDGIITDTEPLGGLRFRAQVADYFSTLLEEFSAKHTFPQRTFTVEDFPDLANSAEPIAGQNRGNPSLVGKPVPIGYGLLSDESLGADAKGVVPAHYVGTRVLDGFRWDEYVVFGHAASGGIQSLFGDPGNTGTRVKWTEDMFGVGAVIPGHAFWSTVTGSSDLYRDYNGRRYLTFYARGPSSDNAIKGSVPFLVNVGGREDVGDSTGNMIDGLITQLLHLFNNDVFGGPYTSGAWLAPPTVPVDLYSRINTASFAAVQAQSELYVNGGFKGAFLLGADGVAQTLTQLLTSAARSGGFDLGVNMDGQLMASMVNPGATLNRAITDITDVIRQSFRSRKRRDQLNNVATYRYGKYYAKPVTGPTPAEGELLPASNPVVSNPDWASGDVTIPDPLTSTSITKYGQRKLDLSMEMVRDPETADAVANLRLLTLQAGPVMDGFTERGCGLDTDLGDRDTLTHFELPPGGAVDRSMRCEVHTLDADQFSKKDSTGEVIKEYRDLDGIDYSGLEI